MQNAIREAESAQENQVVQKVRITPVGAAYRPLTTMQKYHPIAPPKAERKRQIWRQAMHLPRTLSTIYKIIREDFSAAALDESLWAFWGFHQENSDTHYQMRRWQKTQLSAVTPSDVIGGLPVWEMAMMMYIAMEDEDPILEYSGQSGEGLRFLLPNLGRFMGKNEEQARYAAEHGIPWCEGAWCAEERRHSNAFARIIERLTGLSPSRDNPNTPMAVTADEESAIYHIINRQTTEWNAGSSYIVMAAHAAGDLQVLARNIARDEIKHFSIVSSADSYLFGPRPWRRFLNMVKLGINNYRRQRRARSGGALLGANWALAIEGIFSHLLTAFFLSKWLRTVPLRTLTTVFETPSKLPELAAFAPSPERQAEIDETLRQGERKRRDLARWRPQDRNPALQERWYEENHQDLLQNIVATELDGFRSAAVSGSAGEKKTRRQIKKLSQGPVRTALLAMLREYQISNNRHVRGRAANALKPEFTAVMVPRKENRAIPGTPSGGKGRVPWGKWVEVSNVAAGMPKQE